MPTWTRSSGPSSRPPGQLKTADPAPEGRKLHVLVVDDDHAALASIEGVLSVEYDVLARATPLAALELARAEGARGTPFDVVCSDFKMHEMDGVELLRQISKLPDAPAGILVTGYVEVLAGEHRDAEHIQGIVVKPFDPAHLTRLVGRLGRVNRMNRSMRALTARNAAPRP